MVRTSPPVTADRYRPLERLGGTASSVHRARDVLLQRDVVVKSFPGEDGHERWERDALLRERLGPGRAMEVLDGAPDGIDGPFVVMPLARDGSLEDATGPCDPAAAAVLVARLAAGLGCLHRRGVVHGRVGADAVLLDPALGPRWTGDGAPVPADASPEDDVAALARIAVLAVTGPFAAIPAPSVDVVDAVRALVSDAADVGARERLRAGLAARAPRRAPRPPHRFDPRRVPAAGRSRRAALVACVGALLLGGVLGAGAGITGGDASAAVVAGTIGEPVLFRPAPAQALVALPPAPAPVAVDESPAPPRTEVRAPSGGSSSSGMRATSAVRDRSEHRSEHRSTERSDSTPEESESTERDTDDDASTADDADESSDVDTDDDADDADDEADGARSGSGSDRGVVGGLLGAVL